MDSEIARLFIDQSVKEFRKQLSQIETCILRLNEDQIWSRGAPHENSIGNLILHLCGNVRQWICSGIGREQDVRDRESEFSAAGGVGSDGLLSRLKQTVNQAIDVISAVTSQRLLEKITPQNVEVTVLAAIYHVAGHFQLHAGQIIFATKIYAGEDLGLYRPAVRKEA